MLSAGKILLTLIVVVAVAFVVRLLNRRAALKAAPQPPRRVSMKPLSA